jgi:hypothetical protein
MDFANMRDLPEFMGSLFSDISTQKIVIVGAPFSDKLKPMTWQNSGAN